MAPTSGDRKQRAQVTQAAARDRVRELGVFCARFAIERENESATHIDAIIANLGAAFVRALRTRSLAAAAAVEIAIDDLRVQANASRPAGDSLAARRLHERDTAGTAAVAAVAA